MEKNSRKQLTIALAFVWCVPAMLVGCSTPTNDTVTGLVADTTASVKRGGSTKSPNQRPSLLQKSLAPSQTQIRLALEMLMQTTA